MEKFQIIKILGEGSFGCVCRAVNKVTGETVAIKKLKNKADYSWEECLNLSEVKSLRKMNDHPHIVKLLEVIKHFDYLYFVFENMETNLLQFLKGHNGKGFPDESEVRGWCFQMFKALDYVHKSGYMHRDLKPENFLVSEAEVDNIIIKMADFGMAREISSRPPYTVGVCTCWYRAPEVLLGSSSYDSSMDMWSMGVIMAELFNLRPLFPGSSQVDQMHRICSVLGSPNQDSWADGLQLADSIKYRFPHSSGIDLSDLNPTASKNAISLISSLCSWDPRKRPTAAEALQHPFFNDCYYIPGPFPLMRKDCYLSDFSTANPMHTSLFNAKEPERNLARTPGNSGVGNFSVGNINTSLLNALVKHNFQMQYNRQQPSYQPLPDLNIPYPAINYCQI